MVDWSDTAKKDLRNIQDYISIDSPYYGKKIINTIVNKADALENFPLMGRMVPEIMNESVREIFIYSYRIIYEIIDNKISILGVVHGKRDFINVFET